MITKKEYKIAKRIVKEYEQQLNILAVSGAKRKVCPVCKKTFEKGWGRILFTRLLGYRYVGQTYR